MLAVRTKRYFELSALVRVVAGRYSPPQSSLERLGSVFGTAAGDEFRAAIARGAEVVSSNCVFKFLDGSW